MRRIIVSMNVTLDGFMAGPNGELDWHFSSWTEDMTQLLTAQLSKADTLLLGRNTYNAMAGHWPAVGNDLSAPRDDIAYADMMNSYTKIVCSATLKRPTWNNSHVISRPVRQEIIRKKSDPGKDIMVYGSHKLVQYLIKHRLVDQYQLWVHPVCIGRGMLLFNDNQPLELLRTHQLPSGVMVLNYAARTTASRLPNSAI